MIENPPANAGDVHSIPGSGSSPRGGNGNPLQYSCLEMDLRTRTGEPGGLQSVGSQRVRHNWAHTCAHTHSLTLKSHTLPILANSYSCKGFLHIPPFPSHSLRKTISIISPTAAMQWLNRIIAWIDSLLGDCLSQAPNGMIGFLTCQVLFPAPGKHSERWLPDNRVNSWGGCAVFIHWKARISDSFSQWALMKCLAWGTVSGWCFGQRVFLVHS